MAIDREANMEQGATSPATVVSGLGYPNGRDANSAEPTGWQNPTK